MKESNILLDRSGKKPYIISSDNRGEQNMKLTEKKSQEPKFLMKQLRKAAGINQTEFAEKLGFTQTTVSNWENVECVLSVQNVYKVCEILKTTPDILYGFTDPNSRVELEVPCIVQADGSFEPLGETELKMIMTLLAKLRTESTEDPAGKEFYVDA